MNQSSSTTGATLAAQDVHSILLVDDDDVLRDRLARAFRDRGHAVQTAECFDSAIDLLEGRQFGRAVIDLKMPGRSGLELLKQLKRMSERTEVVLLTGYGSIASAVDAIRAGAVNYVSKPADADEILAAFDRNDDDSDTSAGADYKPPTLAQAEWEHIHKVLTECDGNITAAAHLLGIPRRSLQRKLKKLSPD